VHIILQVNPATRVRLAEIANPAKDDIDHFLAVTLMSLPFLV
jgi:hypothetical protein